LDEIIELLHILKTISLLLDECILFWTNNWNLLYIWHVSSITVNVSNSITPTTNIAFCIAQNQLNQKISACDCGLPWLENQSGMSWKNQTCSVQERTWVTWTFKWLMVSLILNDTHCHKDVLSRKQYFSLSVCKF